MEHLYEFTLKIHVVAGVLALLSFWVPALTRKGSKPHRQAGKVFAGAMLVVAVTGLPLSLHFYLLGQWVSATFLLYLLVITMTAVGTAWYALKLRRQPERYYGAGYVLVALLNIASGCVVLLLGVMHGVTLLMIFSTIGILGGIDMLLRRAPGKRDGNWWLLEHLGGMIAGGIAAHVAFGAFGLRRIWPAYAGFDGFIGVLPWVLPVVIGVLASIVASRKYRRGPVSLNG